MRPARPLVAVLLGLAALAVLWLLLETLEGNGIGPVPLPWTAAVGTFALALVVWAAGRPVRRWVVGTREAPLDPLVAARTVALAKAACYAGPVIAAWYGAQALTVLPDVVGARRTRLVLGLVAAVGGIAVSATGFLVQRWCRVPPGDGDGDQGEDDAAGDAPTRR